MIPDDRYAILRDELIRELTDWSEEIVDVARVFVENGNGTWRLGVQPVASRACAFDLAIRDDQTFDLQLADQLFEGQVVESISTIAEIINAISAGRIIRRSYRSIRTGTEKGVAVLFALDRAEIVWGGVPGDDQSQGENGNLFWQDSHFVPYRLREINRVTPPEATSV